ncbi:DUF5666 domain-containing protein [Thiomicrorhabdus sp. ZW0627]|uniref:DUF5666 domain-containing protein n=1 Tax=Thiomicrorhabdus sp. ZW0627 TaxID=3039774 RepID=UPI002436EA33|nr:DUF5666 domain-containing protein [Thiomicrorhabdus sp. ZW0627]MDG6773440.1 DUF5666 domain-containing protein [Thiomicrorhabdus sp. ZW0627]
MNPGRWFYSLVGLFLALLLAGCSTSDNVKSNPMGEIVLISSNSGFGGTGRTQQVASVSEVDAVGHSMNLDSGFGGTGRTSSGFGGTGIIGTIEKFGSIWVNGVEIGLGQKTKIHSNIPGAVSGLKASDLRIGQQVWLETNLDQDKTTTANIHIYYPLAGKIETMTAKPMATEVMINGQRVYIDEGTRLAKNLQLKVGEFVRVSGLPVFRQGTGERENAWQATLIEPQEGNVSWLKKQPDVQFSEKVQRIVMQDNWMTAYKAGELVHVPAGLSSQPKVKMIGPKNVDGQLVPGNEAGTQAMIGTISRDERSSVRPLPSISNMRTASPLHALPTGSASGRK